MFCLVSASVISVGASKPEWHLDDNAEENICRCSPLWLNIPSAYNQEKCKGHGTV